MKTRYILITGVYLLIFALQSCLNEDEPGKNEIKISSHNETESHNAGKNCMNCHTKGGEGEGWFNIAGTVYDNSKTNVYPNATVRLYSGPNESGDLLYTVEVDAKGNFYTTENIDFGTGLYASVQGNSSTTHMNSILSMGECNSCHGNSVDRIWTE